MRTAPRLLPIRLAYDDRSWPPPILTGIGGGPVCRGLRGGPLLPAMQNQMLRRREALLVLNTGDGFARRGF